MTAGVGDGKETCCALGRGAFIRILPTCQRTIPPTNPFHSESDCNGLGVEIPKCHLEGECAKIPHIASAFVAADGGFQPLNYHARWRDPPREAPGGLPNRA